MGKIVQLVVGDFVAFAALVCGTLRRQS